MGIAVLVFSGKLALVGFIMYVGIGFFGGAPRRMNAADIISGFGFYCIAMSAVCAAIGGLLLL